MFLRVGTANCDHVLIVLQRAGMAGGDGEAIARFIQAHPAEITAFVRNGCVLTLHTGCFLSVAMVLLYLQKYVFWVQYMLVLYGCHSALYSHRFVDYLLEFDEKVYLCSSRRVFTCSYAFVILLKHSHRRL